MEMVSEDGLKARYEMYEMLWRCTRMQWCKDEFGEYMQEMLVA